MAARALIDTNDLVYRYDDRFPEKQRIADEVLREGISSGTARIAHQSIVEFVAATCFMALQPESSPSSRTRTASAVNR